MATENNEFSKIKKTLSKSWRRIQKIEDSNHSGPSRRPMHSATKQPEAHQCPACKRFWWAHREIDYLHRQLRHRRIALKTSRNFLFRRPKNLRSMSCASLLKPTILKPSATRSFPIQDILFPPVKHLISAKFEPKQKNFEFFYFKNTLKYSKRNLLDIIAYMFVPKKIAIGYVIFFWRPWTTRCLFRDCTQLTQTSRVGLVVIIYWTCIWICQRKEYALFRNYCEIQDFSFI